MVKTKIFVSAYACEPNLGSEIGVGWHWVLEMSKYFDLWVLTRKSNQQNIEQWFAEHPWEHKIHFLYFDLPKKLRFWKKGLRGVRLYYILWQKLTNRIVKKTMQENDIKIYHLLTYGNALWPASAYGQKQFFIWGPTSAGSSVSKEFSKNYAFKNRSKEFLQRIMAKSLRFNIGFLGRCRDAKLILCKTEQTKVSIPEKYRHKAVVFTDVAVDLLDASKYIKEDKDGLIRYLAVGRLEAWRGFDLLIEAFSKVLKHNENVHLDILGNGSDMVRLKALAEKLKLDAHLKFRGNVPLKEYYQYMANCDVVVNPALKEGAVTTAFDSLSFAKPLVCINSGGYTRYFENTYSIILELTDRESLVENISDAIKRLTNRELRDRMSDEIIRVRNNFTWEEKGRKIRDLILERS